MTTRDAGHVGLIGFGAIGRQLHAALLARNGGTRVTILLAEGSRSRAACAPDAEIVHTAAELVAARPDAVIEAASQSAAGAYVPTLLAAGLPVIVSSVGALTDDRLLARMLAACDGNGGRLITPPGALGGIDYLRAVARLDDLQVVYTSRKPVAAWRAELQEKGIAPDGLTEPHVFFEGSAEEAAKLYPRNLNAGLTIALTVGSDRVTVRVVADPDATGNTHEIDATSSAGTASMRFSNAPSPDNPKTSALTALSILAALDDLLSTQPRHYSSIVQRG